MNFQTFNKNHIPLVKIMNTNIQILEIWSNISIIKNTTIMNNSLMISPWKKDHLLSPDYKINKSLPSKDKSIFNKIKVPINLLFFNISIFKLKSVKKRIKLWILCLIDHSTKAKKLIVSSILLNLISTCGMVIIYRIRLLYSQFNKIKWRSST